MNALNHISGLIFQIASGYKGISQQEQEFFYKTQVLKMLNWNIIYSFMCFEFVLTWLWVPWRFWSSVVELKKFKIFWLLLKSLTKILWELSLTKILWELSLTKILWELCLLLGWWHYSFFRNKMGNNRRKGKYTSPFPHGYLIIRQVLRFIRRIVFHNLLSELEIKENLESLLLLLIECL